MEQYRKTPRANFFDYEDGDYFITICTHDKIHYFGQVIEGMMKLTDIGKFVEQQLNDVSKYNPDIEIPLFVVMPNHIHAIVCVRQRAKGTSLRCNDVPIERRNPNPSLRANPTCQRHVPTLSKYVNSLKGAVTKFAHNNNIDFGWQSRYHDHIIRGNRDGNMIAEYISNNVARWANDCFYK